MECASHRLEPVRRVRKWPGSAKPSECRDDNYFPSATIASTTLSIASLTRFAGTLKLLVRIENATCWPRSVTAYPESALTPPREPVFAETCACESRLLKRSASEPSTPATGSVSRKLAPQGCATAYDSNCVMAWGETRFCRESPDPS